MREGGLKILNAIKTKIQGRAKTKTIPSPFYSINLV